MGERSNADEEAATRRSEPREELRTIAFRLREVQRYLSMRVQQENRRLEAEGIEPIGEATFFKRLELAPLSADDAIQYLIETVERSDVVEAARVVLDDGTTIQGRVEPIDYAPRERLRVAIRPRTENSRYELRTVHDGDRWQSPSVRRCEDGDDDWELIGELETIRTLGE